MTERWRKKLRGIDQVGPSDDVYQRAKRGPVLPEPQSPMQRTSTRVVTAIAAFVVFALAISLFVIPALRLGGNDRLASAGSQIQPLWPWNSVEAVQAWRDDPQPIGDVSVEHFSSPDEVAAGFGRQVLGWGEVWAHEEGTPQTFPCIASGAVASSDVGSAPPPGYESCSMAFLSGSMPPTMAPYVSTTAPPAFRTFRLSPCQIAMTASCDSSSGVIPEITVVVFQPIGDDGPWAVLESKSGSMSISLDPGAELRDDSTVYASGLVPGDAHALLGYHVSSDGCGGSGIHTGFEQTNKDAGTDLGGGVSSGTYVRGQLQVGLSTSGSCSDEPGYVFVTITDKRLDPHDLSTLDPLGGLPPGTSLLAFVAVPATFLFPTAQAIAPTSSPPPTEPGWTTYSDPLGWTIDVPQNWVIQRLDQSVGKVDYAGAAFSSATPEIDTGPSAEPTLGPAALKAAPGEVTVELFHLVGGPGGSATDDTGVPSSLDDIGIVQGGYESDFTADGLSFSLSIRVGGDAPTPEQLSILQRMVSSIAFVPWQAGDQRNGWTALKTPKADVEWEQLGKVRVIVMSVEGTTVMLGPVVCNDGGSVSTTWQPSATCPDDVSQAQWSITGQPDPGNAPGFREVLPVHPVIRAWDGTLLTNLSVAQQG